MKKRLYTLGVALTLVCSACNDWLTVQPETVIVGENLFTTNDGVKNALTGIYIDMRGILYKPEGSFGGSKFSESMACTWQSYSGTAEYDWANHRYDSELIIEAHNEVFMRLYKLVAAANELIAGAGKNKASLDSEIYNVVVGEALAIRALAHLDLIRSWGPMPLNVDATRAYLPYVRTNASGRYEYITFDKYMEFLLADLNEAEILLGTSDPVVATSFEATENTQSTTMWPYRKSRINYYGVLGLQARARLWMGDKEGALRYAKLVKEAKNEDGTSKLRLTNEADDFPNDTWVDGTCYSEHLCGVKCDLYNYSSGVWISMRASVANYASDFVNVVFDGNRNDMRYKKFWVYERTFNMTYGHVLRKYRGFYNASKSPMNFPIIRLSEMYLIIMECGSLEEANDVYQELCTARSVDYVPYTETDRHERVLKEYLRELMGEGQNFFTYKRFGVKEMWFGTGECGEDQYVLPLPEKEFLN